MRVAIGSRHLVDTTKKPNQEGRNAGIKRDIILLRTYNQLPL